MIGRFLDKLPPQMADRFLECRMIPFSQSNMRAPGEGCLIGVANGSALQGTMDSLDPWLSQDYYAHNYVGKYTERFNRLCQRLAGIPRSKQKPHDIFCGSAWEYQGGARAADLIRARVLRTKLRRELGTPHAERAHAT